MHEAFGQHQKPSRSDVDQQALARACETLERQLTGSEYRAIQTLDSHAEVLQAASPGAYKATRDGIRAALESLDFDQALEALDAIKPRQDAGPS
jgi:hypothetical protein